MTFLAFGIYAQEDFDKEHDEEFDKALEVIVGRGGEENVCTSVPECAEEKLDCSKCIEYLTNKKNEASSQVKSLSSEIAVMDNQISLTEARIAATEQQIELLQDDIDITEEKISSSEVDIDKISKALLNRAKASYEYGDIEAWQIILTAESIENFFTRLKYLKMIQYYDQKNVLAAEQSRVNYSNQQNILAEKQNEAKALSAQLESYNNQLEQEKGSKSALLEITKNDEARYQKLIAQVQAERAIVFGGGKDVFMRDVPQGETIGNIASWNASPGCSTGPHLHFEVGKNGSLEDPNNYLSPTSFQYANNYNSDLYRSINPRGDLPWPLNAPIQINQGFGAQPNSSFYGPSGHTGIDMNSLSSSSVKSVKEGKLYGGSYQCKSGPLYYAKVEHSDGLITWYLHVIPN